jgi:hypothetical protein
MVRADLEKDKSVTKPQPGAYCLNPITFRLFCPIKKTGILCLGRKRAHRYSPEDTTYSILFREVVSINHKI